MGYIVFSHSLVTLSTSSSTSILAAPFSFLFSGQFSSFPFLLIHSLLRSKSLNVLKPVRDSINQNSEYFTEENTITIDWEDQEDIEDIGSPWEGAVIYRRNPSITHLEYCTTLERLGLGKLSSDISKTRASVMGLRVTRAVKDYPNGTPVQISIDVTRKKQKMRLDGIIKTVITLGCNRCGEPAAEGIFSNFSLLLSEEPIEEPEIIDIGATFEEGFKSFYGSNPEVGEDDDDASIDWDDRLYFPPEEKEIDISKHIRDMVHLEITINAVCDSRCKGICLKCGTNLNTSSCNCSEEVKEKGYGPLGNLGKQIQQKLS
ncbi:large ribosomal RNA subunit accumulation protein YCED homolog 1, chloroplastic isoform X2 [Herrania umbratica]|uniref:Large ribosomal RNA subunit accumulation protein YCED homolog 1, chloroplastic isoform X2 n=1 Tax=Herrania umbratica TaxID=108875 RepID=A0A6J0ZJH9_9ROSI|nr:large ribosomal RNA subunit accumulation protein YCED homolog 1, chloroplastic isoform X2 [Herrania umbratica]